MERGLKKQIRRKGLDPKATKSKAVQSLLGLPSGADSTTIKPAVNGKKTSKKQANGNKVKPGR